jgi:hypothetical protein
MTDGSPDDGWDDAGLDRLIAHAVLVEPSPEFRARVAARVRLEPPPRRQRGWIAWAGAAAAAAVLAAVVFDGPDGPWTLADRRPEVRATPDRPNVRPADAPVADVRPAVSRGDALRAAPRRSPRARRSTVADATTALFDPREREALAWLVTISLEGRMPAPQSLAPVLLADDPVVTPIEIPTIDVVDVAIDAPAEGEPQS